MAESNGNGNGNGWLSRLVLPGFLAMAYAGGGILYAKIDKISEIQSGRGERISSLEARVSRLAADDQLGRVVIENRTRIDGLEKALVERTTGRYTREDANRELGSLRDDMKAMEQRILNAIVRKP